jgi:flagellar capping protein FliD
MTKEKTVEQIRDEITANYKEQVEILKAMNETNNRLIEAYRTREESLEDYVAALKEQLARVQGLYLGLI